MPTCYFCWAGFGKPSDYEAHFDLVHDLEIFQQIQDDNWLRYTGVL